MSERSSDGFSDGFRITRVADVAARFVDHDWAFPRAHEAAIAAHWQARLRRSPGMFDGTVRLRSCERTSESSGVTGRRLRRASRLQRLPSWGRYFRAAYGRVSAKSQTSPPGRRAHIS